MNKHLVGSDGTIFGPGKKPLQLRRLMAAIGTLEKYVAEDSFVRSDATRALVLLREEWNAKSSSGS